MNLTLYPGTDYFIKCRGNVDLYRNSSGAIYPYSSSLVNITGSNAGSPGYYYFFYNWVYTEITCNTGRTAVTGTDTCFVGLYEPGVTNLFEINPNPGSGLFDVSFVTPNNGEYQLQVANAIGQIVYTKTVKVDQGQWKQKMDLSHFDSGVYQVSISSAGYKNTRKLILQKE